MKEALVPITQSCFLFPFPFSFSFTNTKGDAQFFIFCRPACLQAAIVIHNYYTNLMVGCVLSHLFLSTFTSHKPSKDCFIFFTAMLQHLQQNLFTVLVRYSLYCQKFAQEQHFSVSDQLIYRPEVLSSVPPAFFAHPPFLWL